MVDFSKKLKEQIDKEKTLFNTEEFVVVDSNINIKLYSDLISNPEKIIYIPGNVPSLKNSKDILAMPTGRTICCNVKYIKHPDIQSPKGKIHQYECENCGVIFPKLGSRPTMRPSKAYLKYEKDSKHSYLSNTTKFQKLMIDLPLPIYVGFYFIRKSKHTWDWDNAMTSVMDLMRHSNWIPEDDSTVIEPYPLGWHHDSKNGGVVITILKEKPNFTYLW